jgi:hypothetical protein
VSSANLLLTHFFFVSHFLVFFASDSMNLESFSNSKKASLSTTSGIGILTIMGARYIRGL